MKLCTIGVYGFTEQSFFQALGDAKVGLVIDTRRRRGVRGATYAFANSQRLQAGLASRGIEYVHELQLAPSTELIKFQDDFDTKLHGSRRSRTNLLPEFKARYTQECLNHYDPQALVSRIESRDITIAILCVEQTPDACHRGLVAEYFAETHGAHIQHLVP